MNLAELYLETITRNFRGLKTLGEKAIAQVTDEELHFAPAAESNSIAIIIKHVAGNLISRWTDFLTTDGEKPDRGRDAEFDEGTETRDQLLERWSLGWKTLLDTIASLREEDLTKTVTIRGEPHSVVLAFQRQIVHYAYHVGQIVYLAKQIRGTKWENLSMPKKG